LAYFADLSPCDYFGFDPEDWLLAVGWLEPGHPYSEGKVDGQFVAALAALLCSPWKVFSFRGWHSCSCRRFSRRATGLSLKNIKERVRPDDLTARSGAHNLFVPGRKCVYVAPELILHYIDAHGYSPPKVFQKAVRACPKVLSRGYLHAVVKNGPRGLVEKGHAELDRRRQLKTRENER
jgi:hypothetical protein